MIEPHKGEAITKASATYEHRRFWVGHGYKSRECVQVRLESDNESVYACYTTGEGQRIYSATVPFSKLVEAVKALVDSEAKGGVV